MKWIGPVAEYGALINNNTYSRFNARRQNVFIFIAFYNLKKERIPYVEIPDSDWLM